MLPWPVQRSPKSVIVNGLPFREKLPTALVMPPSTRGNTRRSAAAVLHRQRWLLFILLDWVSFLNIQRTFLSIARRINEDVHLPYILTADGHHHAHVAGIEGMVGIREDAADMMTRKGAEWTVTGAEGQGRGRTITLRERKETEGDRRNVVVAGTSRGIANARRGAKRGAKRGVKIDRADLALSTLNTEDHRHQCARAQPQPLGGSKRICIPVGEVACPIPVAPIS